MRRKQDSHSGLSRRDILRYGLYGGIGGALSGSLWLSGCRKQRKDGRANVLLISIDTLRADHVSCYGYKKATTPHIDRLARQGHRFSNAYTTMPTTLPAHASLLSSLYPSQLSSRRNGEKVPAGATTLPEILQSAGYATAAFVSASVMDARYGLNQGFQTYDDVGKRNIRPAGKTLVKATKWLKKHSGEPFFLFLHFFDPHTPYHAPESFRTKFGAPNKPSPPALAFVPNPSQFTTGLIHKSIAAYDAEIAYADWVTGKLLRELSQLGLDEHTLVVLVSDHGESLDELITRYGYAFDHGEFLYAHQLRIPVVIRLPGMVSPERDVVHTSPVSIIDIMPTILDALTVEPPSSVAGLSLLPVLRGEKTSHGLIFSERRTFKKAPQPSLAGDDYSIIEGKWHLIYSTTRDSELYNMADDPGEISNLQTEHKKAQSLKSKLHQWLLHLKPLFGPAEFETDKEALERLRSLGYVE